MKIILLSLSIISCFFTFQSCCTKKKCSSIIRVNFANFSEIDLDTITLIRSVQNSNFSQIIDSSDIGVKGSDNFFEIYLKSQFNKDIDYKIKLISTGEEFKLTQLGFEKKGCNNCFPFRPKSEYFEVLASYILNGQKVFGQSIQIQK